MSATDGIISALERKKVSDILSEAAKRVSSSKFGSPIRPMERTAKMWSAILGVEVDASLVALCMIALKVSREVERKDRDNLLDICGYASCAETFTRR